MEQLNILRVSRRYYVPSVPADGSERFDSFGVTGTCLRDFSVMKGQPISDDYLRAPWGGPPAVDLRNSQLAGVRQTVHSAAFYY